MYVGKLLGIIALLTGAELILVPLDHSNALGLPPVARLELLQQLDEQKEKDKGSNG